MTGAVGVVMPKQQQQVPTTPAEFEGWWVEFGPGRKAGTVVASRPDDSTPWAFINPGVEKDWRAAPTSRAPQPSAAARIIVQVQRKLDHRDGRLVWTEVGNDDPPRPVFATPKMGALKLITAPYKPPKPRAARTKKAGASRLNTGGAL